MTRNEHVGTRILKAALIGAAALALATCALPANQPSGKAAIVVSLSDGTATASRAIVPGVLSQLAAVDVKITDSRGTVTPKSATAATFTVEDIYPGAATLAVTAWADAAKTVELATGTATVTVVSGGSVSVSVPLTLTANTSGSGSIALALSFPPSAKVSSITASFADGAGTVGVSAADYAAGTATLSGSPIQGGAHILSISFMDGTTVVGRIFEAVNVRTGVSTNAWLSPDGTVKAVRAVSMNELNESMTSLAALTVGGVSVPVVSGTNDYTVTIGAFSAITFSLTGAMAGQNFGWAWARTGETTQTGAIASGAVSPSLPTAGTSVLAVTVTAPSGSPSATYTVTVKRSWTVTFDLAGEGYIAPVIVADGGTVTRPADPTFQGFIFDGWYADAARTVPWAFGTGGTAVTSDAKIYAKWIETGIERVSVELKRPYGSATAAASVSVMQGKSVAITGTLTSATASSWAWFIDGTQQAGATTETFTWTTTNASFSTATPVGEHVVSCVAAGTDGIGYSADVKVTVTSGLCITYVLNRAGSAFPADTTQLFTASATITATIPTNPQYVFVNWNTKADGSGTAYAPGAAYPTPASLVLFAQWRLATPVAVTALKAYARDGKVTLSWTAPTAIADVDHYEITWKQGVDAADPNTSEHQETITQIPASTLKYAVTGLLNYSQHGFDVKTVYKEPTGSGTAAGSATATIYAIPGMGKAEVMSMGNSLLPMSYVPAKTVEYAIAYSNPLPTPLPQSGTPGNSFLMAQTEMTYRLWYTVYQWATNPDRGTKIYTFANAGTPPDSTASDVPTAATGSMPVVTISWRDALLMCNALTEYYNTINNLTGANALECVYYSDVDCLMPIRSVNAGAIDRGTLGSQDSPCVKLGAKGFRLPSANEWACASRYIGDFNGDGDITDTKECYAANLPSGGDVDCITTSRPVSPDYDGDGEVNFVMDVVNYEANPDMIPAKNKIVASFKPNMLGIYDMSGNAIELLSDWGTNPYGSGSFWGNLANDRSHNCAYVRGNRTTQANQKYEGQSLRVVRDAN
jgi:uncharacterized repeat protein (TIGR02543 family)